MSFYTEGCLICGKPLVDFSAARPLTCAVCGGEHSANSACEEGHFVCDACHSRQGFDFISDYAAGTHSKNPVFTATEMMKSPFINMHGPEHHYLVAAALLSAYKNSGGGIDFEKALEKARQRAKNVPGGICGMWGSCGAGIATGIFVSVITGATSLSVAEWSAANQMTSKSLAVIAANGGPRCCKRNTYLAITQAAQFLKDKFGIELELPEGIVCGFFGRNKQCRRERCGFYPKP